MKCVFLFVQIECFGEFGNVCKSAVAACFINSVVAPYHCGAASAQKLVPNSIVKRIFEIFAVVNSAGEALLSKAGARAIVHIKMLCCVIKNSIDVVNVAVFIGIGSCIMVVVGTHENWAEIFCDGVFVVVKSF